MWQEFKRHFKTPRRVKGSHNDFVQKSMEVKPNRSELSGTVGLKYLDHDSQSRIQENYRKL
jgi:hypothetical protein